MKITSFILLCIAAASTAYCQERVLDITAFGAVADGQTSNTVFIQRAIDKAAAEGGGRVVVPAGRFVTGVITLKSGVELCLSAGARLMGSTKRADYGAGNASALVVANGQHHISITGKGTIDGQAGELLKDVYRMLREGTLQDPEWNTPNPWHQLRPSERNRPKLVEFRNCDSVQVRGITFSDGLCWVQNYRQCTNLVIDSIVVESTAYWNNDGIDITDCRHARVTNSRINAADDGICLKSEDRNSRCEDIYIGHCTVRSSASAVKFGTASRGGFKNIVVSDITVYDTYRSAIALECVDGGVMEHIDVRHIRARHTGNAVFIRLGHRNRDSVTGSVRDIYIGDVEAEIPAGKPDEGYPMEGPALRYAHNVFPASITGLPGFPVQQVVLDNIRITYEGGASRDTAFVSTDTLTRITENAAGYPEFSMFGELPAWGLYVRHAEGIQVNGLLLRSKKDDFRPACVFDDVRRLKLAQLNIPAGTSLPVLLLNNTPSPVMDRLQLPAKDDKAIRIQ